MKIILLEEVKKLGEKGALVEVASGYARNFLFPRKLAVPASKSNLASLTTWQKEEAKKDQVVAKRLTGLSRNLAEKSFRLRVKAGEGGRIFGSVTTQDIAELIKKEIGFDFDKKWLELDEPLRHLGEHKVKVRYAKDIESELNIEIIPEEEES